MANNAGAGVGNRGSSAVGRLIQNGKVSGAEMWCLDHDRKVLEQAGSANIVVVRKEEPHMVRRRDFVNSTLFRNFCVILYFLLFCGENATNKRQ